MIRTAIVTCVAALSLIVLAVGSSTAQEYDGLPTCTLAKLSVSQARILRSDQVLVFRGGVSQTASGRVNMTLTAAGTSFRFRLRIASGRISGRTLLPRALADARAGNLKIEYPGDNGTCSQAVRVLAALRSPGLTVGTALYDSASGRLRAAGTISPLTRGNVKVQLQFIAASGDKISGTVSAPIRRGRWSYNEVLPAGFRRQIDARRGILQVSTLFTGYAPTRTFGQVRSRKLLGAPR